MSTNDVVYQLELTFNSIDFDLIVSTLNDAGVFTIQEGRNIANSDGGFDLVDEDTCLSCYFESEDAANDINQYLISSLVQKKDLGREVTFTSYLRAIKSDYLDAWKEYAQPVLVSDTLLIQPSWLSLPASSTPDEKSDANSTDILKIELDPGYAFGSGSHPTTILCAAAVERICRNENIGSLLDVGCGSGILAIIAARLGVELVHGLDIDPLAITAAEENARKNKVSNIIFGVDKLEDLKNKYDVVVANILSGTLLDLYPALKELVKSPGRLILSGILAEEREGFLKSISAPASASVSENESWICIELCV